jgi:RNA polymerase sigma-70 factor (ECF subfamily)
MRYAMSFTKEIHLAEDIVSETFLRAARHCIGYNELPARAWFYKVARNIAIDIVRKRGRIEYGEMEEAIDDSTNTNPEFSIERSEEAEALTVCLSKIPEPYRTVLILKEYENLTYGEIAKVIGVSMDNVKVMLFRGRQKLRNIYRRDYKNEV